MAYINQKGEIIVTEDIIQEEPSGEDITPEKEESSRFERTGLEQVFLSSDENRLRTGWRLSFQILLLVVLVLAFSYILNYFIVRNVPALQGSSLIVYQITMLISVTGSVFVSRQLIDNRSFKSLGLAVNGKSWKDLGVGLGIAAFMMGFMYLIEWALGWLTFEGFAWQGQPLRQVIMTVLVYLFIYLIVGWHEELLGRGYWLQNLEEGLNVYWVLFLLLFFPLLVGFNALIIWVFGLLPTFTGAIFLQLGLQLVLFLLLIYLAVIGEDSLVERWPWLSAREGVSMPWAVVFSSLAFAAAHFQNANFTFLSLLGLLLTGAFIAYGYIRTRQLWLPIGLHIGWNFFLGTILGFPVSGLDSPSLLLTTIEGPSIITGGSFGPEAGLILLPALALGSFLVWSYTSTQE
jgi:membrane protease YdiL (CAAX protease family)